MNPAEMRAILQSAQTEAFNNAVPILHQAQAAARRPARASAVPAGGHDRTRARHEPCEGNGRPQKKTKGAQP